MTNVTAFVPLTLRRKLTLLPIHYWKKVISDNGVIINALLPNPGNCWENFFILFKVEAIYTLLFSLTLNRISHRWREKRHCWSSKLRTKSSERFERVPLAETFDKNWVQSRYLACIEWYEQGLDIKGNKISDVRCQIRIPQAQAIPYLSDVRFDTVGIPESSFHFYLLLILSLQTYINSYAVFEIHGESRLRRLE